ncbi:S-adenosyl-L-methionine-dependent methyltransferase [Phycomyces blakesleeanus]|uniref:S-adenosyl-L-methionine-dependent methyltransferase n=1 Tax=Phycomyces blakesleeanus TaxID=4837 RepID=A0ABR3AU87_PHYBL
MVSKALKPVAPSTSRTSYFISKLLSSTKDTKSYRPAPNSIEDIERDGVRHNALKLAFKGDFKAPLQRQLQAGGCEVLDIGCGSGFWTSDMATKYKLSYFTGIDADKSALPSKSRSKNIVYQRIDITELPLPYQDNQFDFVFIRSMTDFVPDEYWDKILNELVRVMKKGAYLECTEAYADLIDAGPGMKTIMKLVNTSSRSYSPPGSPTTPSPSQQNPLPNRIASISQLMEMRIEHTHTPVGKFGDAVGSLLAEYWEKTVQGSRQKWIRQKLITEKELDTAVEDMRKENETHKTYMSWYSVVAQKKGYKGPVIQFEDVDADNNYHILR